jgi:Asp-tRNA(Asn)/Glu-tRNA(Gln) amidotransferase A subunit family amidase
MVAVCRTPFWHMAEAATRFTLETTIERLSRAGVIVTEVSLPGSFNELAAAHDTVSDYEAWRALAHERLNHYPLLSAGVRDKLSRGGAIADAEYERAKKTIDDCRHQCRVVLGEHDCILTASSPGAAPLFANNDTGNAIFNKLWTALGLPCVSIPGPTPPGGLPVGIQIVAARNTDIKVLFAAETIRQLIELE